MKLSLITLLTILIAALTITSCKRNTTHFRCNNDYEAIKLELPEEYEAISDTPEIMLVYKKENTIYLEFKNK